MGIFYIYIDMKVFEEKHYPNSEKNFTGVIQGRGDYYDHKLQPV